LTPRAPPATSRPVPPSQSAPKSRKQTIQRAPEPPPPPPRRSRAAKHPIVIVLSFFLTLGLLLVLVAGAGVYWGYGAFTEPGPLEGERIVEVSRGSSASDIAATLEERGVISNRWVFIGAAQYLRNAATFQAGEFVFPARISMAEAMRIIVEGKVVQHDITIAEGLTSKQIVDLLNENDILVGAIERIPLEGTLLPETYRFTRGTTRQAMLDRMRQEHDRVVAQAWERRDAGLPLDNPRDLVTLASIVEKETGQADERARVAGVFVNRLKRRMKLQSDPTILYGLYGGSAWDRPRTIFRSDLERPNPYNTYQIAALPPGPIANPGRAAIEAVANPMETDDLFFVADGTGGHAFATTLDEHNRNVARWREIEAERNNAPTSN
jgi:UPF0755 protein